ncbi:MAG TPA: hypothetical protein PKL22_10515 [Saprospiraceae bacterium]|nr:hypothetical protein [Saprospiraceae bacterium]HNT22627.1 hypothetical protein [Saprospiraceae bacterium]
MEEFKFKIGDLLRHKADRYGSKLLVIGHGRMTYADCLRNVYEISGINNAGAVFVQTVPEELLALDGSGS